MFIVRIGVCSVAGAGFENYQNYIYIMSMGQIFLKADITSLKQIFLNERFTEIRRNDAK